MDRYFLRTILIVGALVMSSLFYRFIPDNNLFSKGDFKLKETRTDPVFLNSPDVWVDSVLNTMTPEQRVAQMIMIAAYSNNNPVNEKEVEKLVRENGVGGLIFFQGSPAKQAQPDQSLPVSIQNSPSHSHGCGMGSGHAN